MECLPLDACAADDSDMAATVVKVAGHGQFCCKKHRDLHNSGIGYIIVDCNVADNARGTSESICVHSSNSTVLVNSMWQLGMPSCSL